MTIAETNHKLPIHEDRAETRNRHAFGSLFTWKASTLKIFGNSRKLEFR
jgi:hypothetical protein